MERIRTPRWTPIFMLHELPKRPYSSHCSREQVGRDGRGSQQPLSRELVGWVGRGVGWGRAVLTAAIVTAGGTR